MRHSQTFLFDEPLSNLDAKLRVQMRTEIKKLHQKVKATVVYVTHDQVKAMTLADRIVVMKDGYIEQVGSPMEVFSNPVNTFVASFIGSPPMNLLPERITHGKIELGEGISIPVPNQLVASVNEGQQVIFGIRADDICPEGHGINVGGASITLSLPVEIAEPLGAETLIYTKIAGHSVKHA